MAAPPVAPIGLWGAFDVELLGELGLARVLAHEITRRTGGAPVLLLAPTGGRRPLAVDAGQTPEGDLSLSVPGRLVTAGDLVAGPAWFARLYGADEPVPPPLSGLPEGTVGCFLGAPQGGEPDAEALGVAGRLLAAGASVRDAPTADVLAAAGATPAPVAAEPLLLAVRVLDPDALRRRRELLRLLAALPDGDGAVAVEVVARDVVAAALASAGAGGEVVLLSADLRASSGNAGMVMASPGVRARRLPDAAGFDDTAAALTACRVAVVATAPMLALAASLGVACALIAGDRRAEALARDARVPVVAPEDAAGAAAASARIPRDALDSLTALCDAELERVVGALRAADGPMTSKPDAGAEGAVLAAMTLQRRLVEERTAFQAELSRVEARLDHLLAAWPQRWLEPLRRAYRRRRTGDREVV